MGLWTAGKARYTSYGEHWLRHLEQYVERVSSPVPMDWDAATSRCPSLWRGAESAWSPSLDHSMEWNEELPQPTLPLPLSPRDAGPKVATVSTQAKPLHPKLATPRGLRKRQMGSAGVAGRSPAPAAPQGDADLAGLLQVASRPQRRSPWLRKPKLPQSPESAAARGSGRCAADRPPGTDSRRGSWDRSCSRESKAWEEACSHSLDEEPDPHTDREGSHRAIIDVLLPQVPLCRHSRHRTSPTSTPKGSRILPSREMRPSMLLGAGSVGASDALESGPSSSTSVAT